MKKSRRWYRYSNRRLTLSARETFFVLIDIKYIIDSIFLLTTEANGCKTTACGSEKFTTGQRKYGPRWLDAEPA